MGHGNYPTMCSLNIIQWKCCALIVFHIFSCHLNTIMTMEWEQLNQYLQQLEISNSSFQTSRKIHYYCDLSMMSIYPRYISFSGYMNSATLDCLTKLYYMLTPYSFSSYNKIYHCLKASFLIFSLESNCPLLIMEPYNTLSLTISKRRNCNQFHGSLKKSSR